MLTITRDRNGNKVVKLHKSGETRILRFIELCVVVGEDAPALKDTAVSAAFYARKLHDNLNAKGQQDAERKGDSNLQPKDRAEKDDGT